jgi:glycosyltransferase involved in cell wall biosynthesis
MKYFVITPAKNEEMFISFTLESMIKQTLKPCKWIIVDDGSTDKTKEIIGKYIKEYPWIEMVSIHNKHEQKLYGSKVIRAFNVGYKLIKDEGYDFIVKWDADLSFSANYFQTISDAFSANKKLGICGGYIVDKDINAEIKELRHPRVQGAIKSVSAKCFKDIGGFLEENGWDGIDMLHAAYLGWDVENIPLNVIHHRTEATEYRSKNFFLNNGITHYKQGNDLFLTFIRFVVLLKQKPYLIMSLSYFLGYIRSWLVREPKSVDKEFAKFIKSYHYKRLLSFER